MQPLTPEADLRSPSQHPHAGHQPPWRTGPITRPLFPTVTTCRGVQGELGRRTRDALSFVAAAAAILWAGLHEMRVECRGISPLIYSLCAVRAVWGPDASLAGCYC